MTQTTGIPELQRLFDLQKSHYSRSDVPSYEIRLNRLNRADRLLRDNWQALVDSLQQDFGSRDPDQILSADIAPPLLNGKYIRKQLARWMKPERKPSGLLRLTGQKSYVLNEPLGVVGIFAPFNAPVSLAFNPALEALAAGNALW